MYVGSRNLQVCTDNADRPSCVASMTVYFLVSCQIIFIVIFISNLEHQEDPQSIIFIDNTNKQRWQYRK